MNTNNSPHRVGIYARVSRDSSDNANQLLLLREYCQKMNYEIHLEYVDVISGGKSNRPKFNEMMTDASKRKFDLLLFFALDRLTREGTRQTIHYLQLLESYGITYQSYSEPYLNNSGVFKDVIISLLSTLARQERIRTAERVRAGLARARAQGKVGGRPPLDEAIVAKIHELKTQGLSIVAISRQLGISRGSVYQYL